MFNPEQCDFVSMAEVKARAEQNPAAETARAASIAFVVMAEAGQIDDVTAVENASQFSPWAYPVAYTEGQIRCDPLDGNLYRVNKGQGHVFDARPVVEDRRSWRGMAGMVATPGRARRIQHRRQGRPQRETLDF